ncbi:putative serine aminopeptidase, S33, alpha/Beta hydrolase [Helianthus anomalus]
MIDQFINFVIRPPRAEYNPDQYLWEKNFTLAGRKFTRQDLELRNSRGHTLRCSHYLPSPFPADTSLPCVVYCHGNSGCRADANEAAVILLPSNITVFTLDFSGSGLSDGNYVSLGWHERDDLKVVVSYLRKNEQISRIGLWGRSMGAVTSLLYGAEDPSIAGMVLDSAFSNLFNLMMELVDVYKIRLPKFTVKVALQYMRRVIQKKAKFDIMDINALKVAPKTFIPALFGHAKGDKFIQPHHSDLISVSYAGDKNMIKFDGDHNSTRPQVFYDLVSVFFHNVLHPPQVSPECSSRYEKYYDLGDLQVDAGIEENSVLNVARMGSLRKPSPLQDNPSGQIEECCSYTSSNRESWGRCSSLGSVGEPFPDCNVSNDNEVTLKVLATPLRTSKHAPAAADVKKDKKKVSTASKKSGRDKFEKLEALSQRLRLCILKRVKHRRNHSS